MPSYTIRDVDLDVIEKAKARATREGRSLASAVRGLLEGYAEERTDAATLGAKGGDARAKNMDDAARKEAARNAANARWKNGRKGGRPRTQA